MPAQQDRPYIKGDARFFPQLHLYPSRLRHPHTYPYLPQDYGTLRLIRPKNPFDSTTTTPSRHRGSAAISNRCRAEDRTSVKMASWTMLILFAMTTIFVVCTDATGGLPAECNPNILGEMPPRYRKVCALLNKLQELHLNGYLNSAISFSGIDDYLLQRGTDVKRQDIDHVFMRFGRR